MTMNGKRFHYLTRAVFFINGKYLLAHQLGADNTFLPGGHIEHGENAVAAMYESMIDVNLQILPLGNGDFGYTFSFVNTDSSDIWDFVVWTEWPVSSLSGSFENQISISLDQVFPQFDARNIDSNLCLLNGMYYTGNGFQTAADSGLPLDAGALLYFEVDFFETSFLYGYQTVDSGHAASNGGYFASIGVAYANEVPLPQTFGLLGIGFFGLLLLRKRSLYHLQ